MKVWIVFADIFYQGSIVHAVMDSEEKAVAELTRLEEVLQSSKKKYEGLYGILDSEEEATDEYHEALNSITQEEQSLFGFDQFSVKAYEVQ